MRILAAIPLHYDDAGVFWQRDLGLVVLALRALGHDAQFVALGDKPSSSGRPVLVIPMQTMADPAWWQNQKPDGIILNTWAATRYDDIRRAALSAGCPVIEKLDSDGVKTPRMFPREYLRSGFVDYDLRHPVWQATKSTVDILLRALVVSLLPGILDKKIARCLSRVPIVAAETPLAASRIQRFLRLYEAQPMPKVISMAHPVDVTHIGFDSRYPKQNHVIAVGRWNVAVKGWPLLKRTAERFLESHEDWKVLVAGTGAEKEGDELARKFEGRFQMLGHLDHVQLSQHLREAKIYLLTSHYESFNIAGAEALCAGCSVVGPTQIPSSAYFAGMHSGTPFHRRNPDEAVDALTAEVAEWTEGRRIPNTISKNWIAEVSAPAVAARYVSVFEKAGTTSPKPLTSNH